NIERRFSMTKEAEITTSRETFEGDGLEVNAFVARPDDVEKAPAVIIVHEWWGLNRHIEDIAQRFAEEGFIAVAADLHEGKKTKEAQEVTKLMGALKQEDGLARLQVVLKRLRAKPEVTGIGVTGFCMGGTFALLLACNAKVEASAPFYGDAPGDTTVIG